MKDSNSKYPVLTFLADVWRFLRPYKARFIWASLIRLSGDIALLYPTYAFAQMVDLFSVDRTPATANSFYFLAATFGVAVLYRQFAVQVAKYLGFQATERASLDAGLAMVRHLSKLDITWHEKENAGNKLKRIQRAIDGFDQVARVWLVNIMEISVNFIGMILVIATSDHMIALALIFFLVTYTPLSFIMLSSAARSSREVNIQEEHVYGLLFEILNNIRSVKLMSIAAKILDSLTERTSTMFTLIRTRIRRFQTRNLVLGWYSELFRVVIIVVIGYGILQGRYELGLLVLFYGYFNSLRASAEELSGASEKVIIDKYNISRAMEILREPIVIDSAHDKFLFPAEWKTLELRNITFTYGGEPVLKDFSFTVRRGEKIGIVGTSGAGKSTLFKLLLKEYESYEGDILYDGVPLRDITKADYLKHVAVVLQETEVFNFSLRDNVLIAREDGHGEKMLDRALEIAHVKDYVSKLPDGLDTMIGEKGMKLSGGERQRLGIARAIIKQPQVLFMDEATSHLDIESEEKIQDSLGRFFEEVTAVVIAHRLTTIRKMDKILVLEGGAILESGSFEELYAMKGRFYDLWEKQRL